MFQYICILTETLALDTSSYLRVFQGLTRTNFAFIAIERITCTYLLKDSTVF